MNYSDCGWLPIHRIQSQPSAQYTPFSCSSLRCYRPEGKHANNIPPRHCGCVAHALTQTPTKLYTSDEIHSSETASILADCCGNAQIRGFYRLHALMCIEITIMHGRTSSVSCVHDDDDIFPDKFEEKKRQCSLCAL